MTHTNAHHRPMVYAGGGCSKDALRRLSSLVWGQMYAEGPGRVVSVRFALDNGAFTAWLQGRPFPEKQFAGRVDRCVARGHVPDFVILPDVVADAAATFALSSTWVDQLPPAWPKYFALQDGMSANEVAGFVRQHAVRGLFLGGTDRFKDCEAIFWRGHAWELGVAFHYARAGTPRKFEHAMLVRADSLDSTRLSRSWRDFYACRKLWLDGMGHPRIWADAASKGAL